MENVAPPSVDFNILPAPEPDVLLPAAAYIVAFTSPAGCTAANSAVKLDVPPVPVAKVKTCVHVGVTESALMDR